MPVQVRRAVILLWLTLLISIIATPFSELSELESTVGNDAPAWLFWLFFVAGYGIVAIPIVFIARRHNWARIVLLLLTIGTFLVTIYFWPYADSWWSLASDVGFLALDIVALYWLFTGSGAEWFIKRKEGAF